MKPLVVPPAAQRDESSVQMLSAWIAENGLHCSMKVGMWKAQGRDEPKVWGTILADVVRHISNAIQEEQGFSAAETADTIMRALPQSLTSQRPRQREASRRAIHRSRALRSTVTNLLAKFVQIRCLSRHAA
jgi:hypothetical protein